MALDAWQQRQTKNVRSRHEDAIRTAAAEAKELAGYVLRDLEAGRSCSYAGGLLSAAHAIVKASAAIDAIDETLKIAATDEA